MKKHLAGTVVLLALCVVAAVAQKPDWKDYEYVEDGFAISTPFKPTLEKNLVDTDAGKMEMRSYNVSSGPLWNLAISVNDISRFGDLPARGLLQAAKDGSVAEVKGKLLAEKEILLDGTPGVEFEISGADVHSLIRCYYVNGRTITVISGAKTNFPYFSDTDRFFNSLRFIPAWTEYAYADDGFALSAPYKPSLKSKPVGTVVGQVEMHLYSIDLGGGTGVMINVTDYGKGNKLSADALQLTKSAVVQVANAKLLGEKTISLDSNPGIEFEVANGDYRARARHYIVGTKLVAIVSYAGDGKLLPPGTSRILDSLRLFNPQDK